MLVVLKRADQGDHAGAVGTAIDVVAQEDEGAGITACKEVDLRKEAFKEITTAVNVSYSEGQPLS
jgi:hypothetical protein